MAARRDASEPKHPYTRKPVRQKQMAAPKTATARSGPIPSSAPAHATGRDSFQEAPNHFAESHSGDRMKTRQITRAALGAAVAFLAACGDSTGSDDTATGVGSLSYSYSGARTGSYSANGEFQQNTTSFAKQPFAVGVRSQQAGQPTILILSYLPVTSTTGHMVLLGFPEISGTGNFDLSGANCTSLCPVGLLLFDTNPDLEEDDSQLFGFITGTVNITSNAGGHLRGTFSGTAENFAGDSVLTITNGAFDVPVRNESSLSLNRAVARPTRMLERRAKPE
jgi:hypothetical protein